MTSRTRYTGGGGGLAARLVVRKLVGWLSVVIAALLLVPAAASAAFVLKGQTGQGLPVELGLSRNLSTVTGFAIDWRANCTSGSSLSTSTLLKRVAIRPFPNFETSGSYAFSTVSNGQIVSIFVSAQLHGTLLRNGRTRGTWAAQARVLDANGNQIDSCATGPFRWRATL